MKNKKFEQIEIGDISTIWQESRLGDHIELVYGDGLPERERKNGPIPVFGSNGIIGYHNEALVKGPGVIVGRKGSVGEVTFSKNDFWPIDTTYYLRLKEKEDMVFWYYFLTTLGLNRLNSHSAVPGLNRDDVYEIMRPIPSLSKHRAIAKILSDLDEKIELNHQMNRILESIAQSIFKHWFVDFEFRGYEKATFVNGLPKGWRYGALGEIIIIKSGKRPGEKSETKTGDFTVPLIGASSVMGFVKDVLFNEPILIIGRVGTHGIVQRVSWPSFPSDNTLVIRSKYFEFVYQVLKTIDYKALNVGTTQPLITQTAINKYGVVIPSDEVLEQFEAYIFQLFEKVVANNRESESLMEIRDSLLPKLMSGKIRVK